MDIFAEIFFSRKLFYFISPISSECFTKCVDSIFGMFSQVLDKTREI